MIREALVAELLGAAAFAPRVDQLDSMISMTPSPVREAKKTSVHAYGLSSEARAGSAQASVGQHPIVSCQPAIECTVHTPLSVCRNPYVTTSLGHKVGVEMLG